MQDNKLIKYSVVFIAVVLAAIVLQTLQQVMRPLAIALLLLFISSPLARFSKEKRIPVWLTFAGLLVVLVLLLSWAGSFIDMDNFNLEGSVPGIQQRLSQDGNALLATLSKLGVGQDTFTPEKLSQFAATAAMKGLGAVRTLFSESLLALILLMFLVQSKGPLFSAMEGKYGSAGVARLEGILRKIETDVVAYFSTKALMSFGTAGLSAIVLLLFGAKFIFGSAILIFLLNFIPIVGSLIAVVVVVGLYAVLFGLSAKVGWLLLAMMAVQILFGNILEPRIAGKRLNMSPILILISLYVWGWIWGVTGMLLSVPLTILILVVLKHTGSGTAEHPVTGVTT